MTIINAAGLSQRLLTDNSTTARHRPSDRDHSSLFRLSDAQQTKLQAESDNEKQLRKSAGSVSGQSGQAEALKRQMLHERLKLLLQQVALMDKQAAKAAMAEVKRIAGELRQMSAQIATNAAADTQTNTPAVAAQSETSQSPPTQAAPTTPVIAPGAPATEKTGQSEQDSAPQNSTLPAPKDATGKTKSGDELDELKEMLKRILRALKKRLEDAPDNQTSPTNVPRTQEPSEMGFIIDIKV